MEATVIAAVAAVAAVLTAISGIIFTIVKLRDERREREREFGRQEEHWQAELVAERRKWTTQERAALRTQFLAEVVRRRLEVFADVFAVLGTIRDVPDPNDVDRGGLESDRGRLRPVADQLIAHLYGPAGLIMTMNTRNQILSAWYIAELFISNSASSGDLVRQFFQARRALRADLQFDDAAHPITVAAIENEIGTD